MKTQNRITLSPFTLLVVVVILSISCKEDGSKEDGNVPLLSTSEVTIDITTATSGGNIISDGGTSVTARGVCWGLTAMPTTNDNKTTDGAGTGNYTSEINGLTANTRYYVRAYAINAAGTAYGTGVTFITYVIKDIDGNGYHSIKIGTQEWMQENLKTTKYRDGTDIPNVTQTDNWVNLSSGAYCDYNNDPTKVAIYGRLYNLYAVVDSHNVCPVGWHVPSLNEGNVLINELGGETIAGGKMKSTGTLQNGDGLWYSPNAGATNLSGFNGTPGGTRFDVGDFRGLNGFMDWRTVDGWTLVLWDANTNVDKFFNYSTNGTSVRCVKD